MSHHHHQCSHCKKQVEKMHLDSCEKCQHGHNEDICWECFTISRNAPSWWVKLYTVVIDVWDIYQNMNRD